MTNEQIEKKLKALERRICCANSNNTVQVESGTYTPTVDSTTNVSANTIYSAQYMRVGDVVTVSGSIRVTPTNALNSITTITLNTPITTSFQDYETLSGTCWGRTACNRGGVCYPNANSLFDILFEAASTSPTTIYYHYTYIITAAP